MSKLLNADFFAKLTAVNTTKVKNLTEVQNAPLPENCVHFTLPIVVAVPNAETGKSSIACPVISVDIATKEIVGETYRSTNGFMFPVTKPFIGYRYPRPTDRVHRFGSEFAQARTHYQVTAIGSKGFKALSEKMDLAVPEFIDGKQEYRREIGGIENMDMSSPVAKIASTTMYNLVSDPASVVDKAVLKEAYTRHLDSCKHALGNTQTEWITANKADIWFLN